MLASAQQIADSLNAENSTRPAHKFRSTVHNENARRMTLDPKIGRFARLDNHIGRAVKIGIHQVMTSHYEGRDWRGLFLIGHVSLSEKTARRITCAHV
jgi:hypothetical protein